ncbi:unnamed protein product [Gadus morhua 'NCC']
MRRRGGGPGGWPGGGDGPGGGGRLRDPAVEVRRLLVIRPTSSSSMEGSIKLTSPSGDLKGDQMCGSWVSWCRDPTLTSGCRQAGREEPQPSSTAEREAQLHGPTLPEHSLATRGRLGVAGSQGAKGQPGNRWWANHVENKALEEECRGGTTDRSAASDQWQRAAYGRSSLWPRRG